MVLCLGLLCSGCFGARELNQRAFIVALAFDQAKDKMLEVTAQMPIPAKMGSDQKGSGGKTFLVMSAKGRTVSDALNKLQLQLDRELFTGHARLLLFGEKLARKQGIEDVVDYFKRDFRIQRVIQLAIVRGDPKKILEVQPPLEENAATYIYSVLAPSSGISGLVTTDLGEYLVVDSDLGIEPTIPGIKANKKTIENAGAAVMARDRVVGWLSPSETLGFSIVMNEFLPSRIIVPSPTKKGERIAVQLRTTKSRHRVRLKNGKVQINTTVTGGFHSLEFTGHEGPRIRLEKPLEDAVNRAIVREIKSAIKHAQSLHEDIFGYGRLVHAYYPGYWSKIRWQEEFPKIDINVRGKIQWAQSVRRPSR
jgi:spore germination protein KC